jgi:hypothetical protein
VTGAPRAIVSASPEPFLALTRHGRNHLAKRAPAPIPKPDGDPLDELVAALRVRALAGNPADTREYRLALAARSNARHAAPPRRVLAAEPEVALRGAILAALEPFRALASRPRRMG